MTDKFGFSLPFSFHFFVVVQAYIIDRRRFIHTHIVHRKMYREYIHFIVFWYRDEGVGSGGGRSKLFAQRGFWGRVRTIARNRVIVHQGQLWSGWWPQSDGAAAGQLMQGSASASEPSWSVDVGRRTFIENGTVRGPLTTSTNKRNANGTFYMARRSLIIIDSGCLCVNLPVCWWRI